MHSESLPIGVLYPVQWGGVDRGVGVQALDCSSRPHACDKCWLHGNVTKISASLWLVFDLRMYTRLVIQPLGFHLFFSNLCGALCILLSHFGLIFKAWISGTRIHVGTASRRDSV